jgi:hypothetical protein
MRTEQDKWHVEQKVFLEFIEKACLPIELASIEKQHERSMPDIFCTMRNGDRVAFELVEICAEDIAATHSALREGGTAVSSTADPTAAILRRKLHKTYETSRPIELLCYTSARTVSPDDQIITEARNWAGSLDGPFRRVWLLGEKDVYDVWSAS